MRIGATGHATYTGRMRITDQPPLQLTYCLNIHAGETPADILAAVRGPAAEVKARVSPDRPFGLGLRLGAAAVARLSPPAARAELRAALAEGGFYAFTVNAFPYGPFHGTPVKARVYAPDWRAPERLAYTLAAAGILAGLLPEGVEGSLSTVPGAFKADLATGADVRAIADHLVTAARGLDDLRRRTGRTIRLALEPEPGCLLETALDAAGFWSVLRDALPDDAVRAHLGLCLDTCHHAVAGEDLDAALDALGADGIPVCKIQLSAAVIAENSPAGRAALARFDEPVYLHQVRAFHADGRRVAGWSDLPDALAALPGRPDIAAVRVHTHVPLTWAGEGPLRSTRETLTPAFWDHLRAGVAPHLEVETYTYDLLPPGVRGASVAASVAGELDWVRASLRGGESATLRAESTPCDS